MSQTYDSGVTSDPHSCGEDACGVVLVYKLVEPANQSLFDGFALHPSDIRQPMVTAAVRTSASNLQVTSHVPLYTPLVTAYQIWQDQLKDKT